MIWLARALVVLMLPVCLLTAVASGAAATPLPPQLIQLRDLRRGYVTVATHVYGPAAATERAHVGGPLLLAQGWQGGYQALFRRRKNPGIQVGELADRFRTAGGAMWWYGVSLVTVPATYHAIQLPTVGDQSTAVQNKAWVGIIFQRGTWVMDVYVSSQVPDPSLSVLALARLVDRRL